MVDDVEAAEPRVLALGARRLKAKTAGHGFTPIRPGIRSASYPARRGLRPSENHQALSNCRDIASPVARTPRSLTLLIAQPDRICICMMRVARLSVIPRAEASRCAVHTEPPMRASEGLPGCRRYARERGFAGMPPALRRTG